MSSAARDARQEVPERTRIFYGLGSVAEGTKDTAFNIFLLFYYNNVLNLPGTLAGLAIFIALCVDAITDPLMGSISDNTRTRWGRRHPYMYASALPMAAAFWLLFNPPQGLAGGALFAWLTGFAVLTRVAMTLYSVPSNAMVPEMTTQYDERTQLVGYRFLFGWLAGLSVALAGYLVFFREMPGGIDGRLNAEAYGGFAFMGAVVIAIGILMCAAGTHHLIGRLRRPPDSATISLRRSLVEVRDVFRNRSFRMLVAGAFFSAAAWGYINAVSFYMNTYFWGLTAREIGFLTMGLYVSVFAAFGLAPVLGSVFDKKRTAVGLCIFGLFFGPLPIFLRLAGWFPENGTRELMATLFLHTMILFAALISVSILTASMIADVTDEGELETGRRQEGVFAAVIAFVIKATAGMGTLLAGMMLDAIAFPTGQDVGAVQPDIVRDLGEVVGPGIMVLFTISVLFLARYRITRARHTEVLEALSARQAAQGQVGITPV